MNERIRKLMLEAGYAAPELAGRANKLAELIVRECAELCTINDKEQGDILKQHFGIK